MLALLLALALGQARPLALPHPAGPLFTNPATLGSLAFFELAPASGAGMGAACACAAITGAKGETVTFSRAGAATCSPLGLATTGITTASLVECGANLPRVEASGGVRGLRVAEQRSNALLRFIDLANAAWSDVGTPALTGAQPSPFTGTYANLGVQVDDNDAAALEGRAQTVTVTAAVAHTMHCYVRAGTLASATVSLDGTTASITGLSTTTWSIVEVTDVSSSGVAISAQVLAGAAASDVGTVVWGGCQVEQGLYRTSIIPTVTAVATRNEETVFRDEAQFGELLGSAGGSVAATAQCLNTANRRIVTLATSGGSPNVEWDVNFPSGAVAVTQWFTGATSTFTSALAIDSVSRRWAQFTAGAGSTLNICRDGACQAGGSRGANQSGATSLRIHVGNYVSGAFRCDGIITGVCVDPSPSRCR